MKQIHRTLFILLLILVITSCNKVIDEYYLSQEMKSQIPFEGYEQITFINNNGGLEIINAGERINDIYESQEGNIHNVYKYIQEKEWITFENDNSELVLKNSSSKAGDYLTLTFTTNGQSFSGSLYSPLNAESLRFDEQYHDSLIVNDAVYYKVFSDSLMYTIPSPELPHPNRIYYTTKYGVIKIDYTDGTTWELEEIKWTN